MSLLAEIWPLLAAFFAAGWVGASLTRELRRSKRGALPSEHRQKPQLASQERRIRA